jgi:hypothetical protein
MNVEFVSGINMPKEKTKPLSKAARTKQTAIDNYCDAYKSVYGVTPEMAVKGIFVYVGKFQTGVTIKRLQTMTQQLKLRAEK